MDQIASLPIARLDRVKRICRLLLLARALVASLLTFPAGMVLMSACWFMAYTVAVARKNRAIWLLVAWAAIVVTKRIDWPAGLWFLMCVVALIATASLFGRRGGRLWTAACPPAIWCGWSAFAVSSFQAGHLSRLPHAPQGHQKSRSFWYIGLLFAQTSTCMNMASIHPLHSSLAWIDQELAALAERDLSRRARTHRGPQDVVIEFAGRELVNFGSNDYLALAGDARLAAAAKSALDREGCGSGASPLLAGHSAALAQLESRLSEFEGAEAAVVFSSGFAANTGAIAALAGPGDAVFSDALNHASIVDGCRLSRADVHVYPHVDCQALEKELHKTASYRRRLIVTDSLFSMEGDLAPLGELADLAERYDAMLMVDEAHATGVLGALGRGACELMAVEGRVAVRMGTLSKALGTAGGFVCGSRALADWLVNRARPYIFSTALAPPMAAAAATALDIVAAEPERRGQVLRWAQWLREQLTARGWQIGRSASQIVPLMVGDARRAVELSARLAEHGVWVPAIRPPSVPQRAARLRISICHGHDDAMLGALLAALDAAGSVA